MKNSKGNKEKAGTYCHISDQHSGHEIVRSSKGWNQICTEGFSQLRIESRSLCGRSGGTCPYMGSSERYFKWIPGQVEYIAATCRGNTSHHLLTKFFFKKFPYFIPIFYDSVDQKFRQGTLGKAHICYEVSVGITWKVGATQETVSVSFSPSSHHPPPPWDGQAWAFSPYFLLWDNRKSIQKLVTFLYNLLVDKLPSPT